MIILKMDCHKMHKLFLFHGETLTSSLAPPRGRVNGFEQSVSATTRWANQD